MDVHEYLKLVAYTAYDFGPDGSVYNAYYSDYDDSYLCMVGNEESVKFLADREITECLEHGVGFSPKTKKWYGWSHRAIYGFAPGSKCKAGDCHYRPKDEKDEVKDCIRFWSDYDHKKVTAKKLKPGLIEVKFENRSWPEALMKYWFNYPELELEFKLRMFWKYDILPWFTEPQFLRERVNHLLFRCRQMWNERSGQVTCILHEYDPIFFGKGEWTAQTWADAREMARDFCEGVS